MIYCAIIGDIIDSKKIRDRQAVQDHFKRTLDILNKEYDAHLASNLTVTLGDECQGLLRTPYLWYEIIQKIKNGMGPTRMLFGVGIGEMSTDFEKETSIGADGQPYWSARQMLNELKQLHKKDREMRRILYHSDTPEDLLINALLACIETIQSSRTDKQTAAVRAMDTCLRQETVAEKLGINQSAVSQRLRSALYYEVAEMEKALNQYLKARQY